MACTKDRKKFSVVISVYKNDNSVFFDMALDSVTNQQTVKPSEIVLIVDGPVSEEINKVIDKYSNIIAMNVIRLEVNKGLGNALNLAVSSAKYPLIARMDSDDISTPTRFEEELLLFEKDENIDIVGGDINEFADDENNVVAKRMVPCKDIEIKEYMKTRCPLNHVTVMFKKEAVIKCGNYQDLFWNEDYYLWIKMAEQNCKMANTGTVLVNVRTGSEMYKRRGGKRYFESELYLQRYMLSKNMINIPTFCLNVIKRFIIQILLPSNIRGWVFKQFAREE